MSFLRALRAYIGLGPDEDIEDRYLYELNSRRRELDLDEIEAEEFDLEQPPAPAALEIESDDVVIVTPGGGRSAVAGGRQGRSRNAGRAHRQGRRRPIEAAAPLDAEFGQSPFADRAPDEPRPADRDHRSVYGELDTAGAASGVSAEMGRRADEDLDAEGLLDFLEDETFRDEPFEDSGVRTRPRRPQRSADEGQAVVRSLDSMRAKPRTILPESFGDAKLVADEFKRDIPVLLNLQSLDRELARRLIDFASGICYALDGSMEKIASQVFLLIPDSVVVSDEDRRRIEERGYAR